MSRPRLRAWIRPTHSEASHAAYEGEHYRGVGATTANGIRVPLDAETAALLDAHIGDADAIRTIIFGRCWADSPWTEEPRISLNSGESIEECADRLELAWSPRWLLDAGCDLAPVVERVVSWDDAPSAWPAMTGKTVFTRA